MGSAVIKQRSAEKLMQEPIDLDTFSDLAKEYEKLKNVGLTVEEIHKLLNFRLHSALNSANVESKQENAGKLAAEDEVREARLALPPVKTENASAIKVATLDKKEVESTGTVLLVDDSVVAMKVSAKILTSLNFEVVMCYSAQDGYDKLIESPHKFSLVLLDIVMPKIDGVELLSWIKDKPEIAHVKVYMLSGLEDQTLAGIIILLCSTIRLCNHHFFNNTFPLFRRLYGKRGRRNAAKAFDTRGYKENIPNAVVFSGHEEAIENFYY